MSLTADDGDGPLYNCSLILDGKSQLEVHRQEGVQLGGTPEYNGGILTNVHNDYRGGRFLGFVIQLWDVIITADFFYFSS